MLVFECVRGKGDDIHGGDDHDEDDGDDDDDSKVVKEDMIEAVLEHLSKDFFPDEPVFRSLLKPFFKSS